MQVAGFHVACNIFRGSTIGLGPWFIVVFSRTLVNLATFNSTLLNPRLSLSNIWQSRLLVQDCAAKLEKLGLQGAIQEVSMIKVNQEKWYNTAQVFRVYHVLPYNVISACFFARCQVTHPHPVLGLSVWSICHWSSWSYY